MIRLPRIELIEKGSECFKIVKISYMRRYYFSVWFRRDSNSYLANIHSQGKYSEW